MNTERTWIHVDMDMFFAACEIRERPELNDRPLAIGDYSMIMTTNYKARKWGVRPAMPGFIGKTLCPQLSFVKSNKEKYKKISEEEFIPILKEYDPNLETVGLDEANLDVTDYLIKHNLNTQEGRIELGTKIR
jgi:DNA polymerase kappa